MIPLLLKFVPGMSKVNTATMRGSGMIVLQILRVCTVVTLAILSASSWILILRVDKGRNWFIFECASHFFTSILCVLLILSEFPLVSFTKTYFRSTWPVLSDQHGLTWLGLALLIIGCNILGNLNRPAYDDDKLGKHFSKLVLAGAILAIIFGILNMIGSLVWRDGKDGINARDIRSDGSLAKTKEKYLPGSGSISSLANEKARGKFTSFFGKKKQKDQQSRPVVSRPGPPPHDLERGVHGDERKSPIVPGVTRPQTALHPIHAGADGYYSPEHHNMF